MTPAIRPAGVTNLPQEMTKSLREKKLRSFANAMRIMVLSFHALKIGKNSEYRD